MDEKLEGVAYRRDIEHFVARDEIERRIDKAVDGAKAEAAKGLAEIAGQVRDLRKIGWGLASAALLAFGGSCWRRSVWRGGELDRGPKTARHPRIGEASTFPQRDHLKPPGSDRGGLFVPSVRLRSHRSSPKPRFASRSIKI